ncbi:MAG TPA: NUDIX hydrolase [bacterium]|nr:NUDIX hydrolase [bacterium]
MKVSTVTTRYSYLEESSLSSEKLVDGHLLKAWRDVVQLPDGKTGIREYIRHPGAVIMLPLFENGDTMLIRQFRFPPKKIFWELPAGKLDGPEDPLVAAQRELIEETGWSASHWTRVGSFYPCIGYSDERMILYIAEDLTPAESAHDDDEFIERFRMPLGDALQKVWSGEIDDMKTIAALLLAEHTLRNNSKTR